MAFKYNITLDKDVLDVLRDKIKTAPKRVNFWLSRSLVQNSRKRTLRKLRNAPSPNSESDYPLVWRSERQRKFVMAKLRREGLPYRRTNAMVEAWEIRGSISNGNATLEVVNDSPQIDFVTGSGDVRQPMFKRWYYWEDIILEEEKKLNDQAIDFLLGVLD